MKNAMRAGSHSTFRLISLELPNNISTLFHETTVYSHILESYAPFITTEIFQKKKIFPLDS